MIDAKENIKTEIRWHVVSVNSRMEIETANRINDGGFIAHCPTFQKKYGGRNGARHFLKLKIEPLFPSYIFVQRDDAFRKDLFETTKVKLIVFRKQLLTDAQMTVINCTANDLTLAQSQSVRAIPIKRGDVMQILHGAMRGEPVDVLEARKARVLVGFKDRPGFRPVWINSSSLARAV